MLLFLYPAKIVITVYKKKLKSINLYLITLTKAYLPFIKNLDIYNT